MANNQHKLMPYLRKKHDFYIKRYAFYRVWSYALQGTNDAFRAQKGMLCTAHDNAFKAQKDAMHGSKTMPTKHETDIMHGTGATSATTNGEAVANQQPGNDSANR